MLLQFKVNKQHIYRVDSERPVADSKNYLFAHFDFETDEWNGITKSVNFWRKGKAITVILDDDGNTLVPWEVIKEGYFEVSCFGGDLVTNDRARVLVVRSGYKIGVAPKSPTPDAYAQIISNYERLNGIIKTDLSGDKFLSDDGSYKYVSGTSAISHIMVNGEEQVIVDKTVNIPVPTKNSQLQNDAGYLTEHQSLDDYYNREYIDIVIEGANQYVYDFIAQKKNIYPSVEHLNNAEYIATSDSLVINVPANYTGNDSGVIKSPQYNVLATNIPFDIQTEVNITCNNVRIEYYLLDADFNQVGSKQFYIEDGESVFKLRTEDSAVKYVRFSSFTVSNFTIGVAKSCSFSHFRLLKVFDNSIRSRIDNISSPVQYLELSTTPTYVTELAPATYIVSSKGILRNNPTLNTGFNVSIGVMIVVNSNGVATVFNGNVIIRLAQDTVSTDTSSRLCYYKTGSDIEALSFEKANNKVNAITSANKNSTTLYPSLKAITDYIDSKL